MAAISSTLELKRSPTIREVKKSQWICKECTYINDDELNITNCKICKRQRSLSWKCKKCKYINIGTMSVCESCKHDDYDVKKENTFERPKLL